MRLGAALLALTDVRVGTREHERHLVCVRPADIVGRRAVLVVEPDDLAVASGDAGGRALDDKMVTEVSSHDGCLPTRVPPVFPSGAASARAFPLPFGMSPWAVARRSSSLPRPEAVTHPEDTSRPGFRLPWQIHRAGRSLEWGTGQREV
ncbi:hypothetical protein SLNWT_3245 [Streptomyces albus]|uniref:Uncharacterized protein n=1 Tax=Streptomyces albus (strain ATCC 21838 / DSM 41398 / FERM P-419 / JCM 4703 / NBRC 107858) TaxID=1081613 RepID=A0A0B5EYB6_STRA4|nr:hypothetical protein SLNWT_3245 [Streptomyces albus]AOU77928.1 hypothetical protein SLNHY_3237 [Streptomyces albus]AYN33683.1 hypothetical protein DUI70_3182 [Streptomyces albus]